MLNYRPLTIEDLPLRMKWLNDPEIYQHLGTQVRGGTDLEFHQNWFEGYLKDEGRKIFIILDDQKAIGQVGLLDINKLDRNAGLYIVIGESEYRGKGIGTKALRFICDFGFKELGLHKIYLEVHANNKPAIKCYQKFGFKEEGYFKESIFYDGKFEDEVKMAIFEN